MLSLGTALAFLAAPFMPAQKEQEVSKPRHIVDGLIEWLETKNADGVYQWFSIDSPCMLRQYGEYAGFSGANCHYMGVIKSFNYRNKDGYLTEPEDIGHGYPRTYGAALQRARAYKRKYNL